MEEPGVSPLERVRWACRVPVARTLDRALLVILAEAADRRTLVAKIGVRLLRILTRTSQRRVVDSLNRMEADGLLSRRSQGAGRPKVYVLHVTAAAVQALKSVPHGGNTRENDRTPRRKHTVPHGGNGSVPHGGNTPYPTAETNPGSPGSLPGDPGGTETAPAPAPGPNDGPGRASDKPNLWELYQAAMEREGEHDEREGEHDER